MKMGDKGPIGLTDPEWELVDPNPDVFALFNHFSEIYFDAKLASVTIEWSKRMTSCAGVCYFYPVTGLCVIRLSEPLLKLRPRRDLVETLLHEMIHAYLFVTDNNVDREEHGPLFLRHMMRINAATGANVTVYHTFNEEVNSYKVHVWKCLGPCSKQYPYYGIVRRTMNRPPGKNDSWWPKHEATCGGLFLKIAGPKTRAEIKAEKKKVQGKQQCSVTDYFPAIHPGQGTNPVSLLSDAVKHCTMNSNVGNQNGVGNVTPAAEGIARDEYLWPGAGNRLGGSTFFPERKTPHASATITSGALLAEQQDKFGANEDSCSSSNAGHNISNAAFWNNEATTSQLKGIGGDEACKPGLKMGGGEAAFGAATSTPSVSPAPLSHVLDIIGNAGGRDELQTVFPADENFTEIVDCPICFAKVLFPLINVHLDLHCGLTGTASAFADLGRRCAKCNVYLPDYMLEEHRTLCMERMIDPQPAAQSGIRRYGGGSVTDPLPLHAEAGPSGIGHFGVGSLTVSQPLHNEAGPSGIKRFGGGSLYEPQPLRTGAGPPGIERFKIEEIGSSDDDDEPVIVNVVPKGKGRLVKCPACFETVLEDMINEHLDQCAT